MSTVTRMIQTTTITSSLTYSNSFLPGLSAPTLACFLSILNIVSNQTDPFRRWVRLCSSSAQSLTASHLLSPSYFTANKNLVPYNGLLGPTWCRIWFISLTLSPILVLYAHSTPTTLASPSFPKYVRCSQDVCWLVLLLEQYFLYVPARQTPLAFFISLVKCHPTNEDHTAHPLVLKWLLPFFPGMSPSLYPVLISLPLLLPPPTTELTTV